MVQYSELVEIEVDKASFNLIKEKLINENLALVLLKDGKKILVTDKNFIEEVKSVAKSINNSDIGIKEYQYSE
jgi:predicted GTPase